MNTLNVTIPFLQQLISIRRYVVAILFFGMCPMLFVLSVYAGGSGLNTAVIVNHASSNSCIVANHYCEKRQVPAENVLRINWTGGNITWSSNEFQTVLLTPLLEMLATRQLTNQIDYIVLSMDIPYRTFSDANISTTAALYYGIKSLSAPDTDRDNSYAGSEAEFAKNRPATAPGYSFLTTMLTGESVALALQLVDRGIASDATFPPQPIILAKSSDPVRNSRHVEFDNAIFNARVLGRPAMQRINSDTVAGQSGLLGYQTGLPYFQVSSGTFIPGAIADSLTSFGGIIFGPNDQTNLLAFLKAGATGSYGTVDEPGSGNQQFPSPQVYFYQSRGFTLAEAYYQSIAVPFRGLIVGEPLAAPFSQLGSGAWHTNLPNALLSNTTNLSVQLRAAAGLRPLQSADLFVDGKFFTTLTNLNPRAGNQLSLLLNGYPISYTVLSNDTLSSIATALTALINQPVATNAVQIKASTHGDRIELQSIAADPMAVPHYVTDSTPTNAVLRTYAVQNLPDSAPPRMLLRTSEDNSAFQMDVELPSTLPYAIEATTNFVNWACLATNNIPGVFHFQDFDSTNFPARFYRMRWPDPTQPPALSLPRLDANGVFRAQLTSVAGLMCVVQASTNLTDWSPVFTNQFGGTVEFLDPAAQNLLRRFYRVGLSSPVSPSFVTTNALNGDTLIRIDSAVRPYTVAVTTNQTNWITLQTNFHLGKILTAASSSIGSADTHSTFLTTSQPEFLSTTAYGRRKYSVSGNSVAANAWLQFTITKTNGQTVIIGVTNQTAGIHSSNLAIQVYALINSHPDLQGPDGVIAEDFNVALSAWFNLRARNPGLPAANISITPRRYGLNVSSANTTQRLNENLSDLQTRNHLYVTAGAQQLNVNFSLDTTQLPDGYHELTAVAYEGSSVRTQTRTTIPVCISNSPLSATLTLLDLTNNAPVNATYHIQVTANTNNVSLTTLFSTGGPIGFATNNPSATFDVMGTNLWTGRHPFYAIVETATGQKFRTQTAWIQLQ